MYKVYGNNNVTVSVVNISSNDKNNVQIYQSYAFISRPICCVQLFYFSSCCITTLAISLELKGFCPVIKFPSTTTFDVIGINAFLYTTSLSLSAASRLNGTFVFRLAMLFLKPIKSRQFFTFNKVVAVR